MTHKPSLYDKWMCLRKRRVWKTQMFYQVVMGSDIYHHIWCSICRCVDFLCTSVALRGCSLSHKLHSKAAPVYFKGTYSIPILYFVANDWMVNWTVIAYLSCCVTNKQTGTVAENAACLARMTMTTVQVKVIHVLPKLSLLIMTSYASSADMLASLFPQSQKKKG